MRTGKTYIIAEISANHNGSLEKALELVKIAADSGADAVKIQTYTADSITMDADTEYFKINEGTMWDGRTLYDLYQEASLPYEWHAPIFKRAAELGIDCFSTPFDEDAVDFLEQFNPPYYKIASFELTHHPLLKKVAETGRPVIMSTGMGLLEEIEESVAVLKENGCSEIILLKCTSSYPAPVEEANLVRIKDMAERFQVKTGLSDHTLGIEAPLAAVALGAEVIEKHFCVSREEPGPDSAFSLEPDEFAQMVKSVRLVEKALGAVTYERTPKEERSVKFRRSVFATRDIKEGEEFTTENIKVVRPSDGLEPKKYWGLVGKPAKVAIRKGHPIMAFQTD